MMLICMNDVKVLLEFFRVHVVNIKRGAKVLLERIEDNEESLAHTGSVIDFTGIPSTSIDGTKTASLVPEEATAIESELCDDQSR